MKTSKKEGKVFFDSFKTESFDSARNHKNQRFLGPENSKRIFKDSEEFRHAQKSKKISDKIGVLLIISLLFLSILFIHIVIAAENETAIDKAYTCLEDKVKDKCNDLSPEEQAFTLLAISECKSELIDKSKNDECWPSGGCRLRETSLALLALDNAGSSTTDIEDWLLAQKKAPDLEWYLEIDTDEQSSCKISYSDRDYTITIKDDKKITGSAGNCLSLSTSGYFLKISSNCLGEEFTISCNKDFITTLLYKKTGSNTWYVSSKTNSASADGSTTEQVESYCFQQNNQCNYEGSLWATFALSKAGQEIDAYLPYLIAHAEENEEFSPFAFLYFLTSFNDYFSNIIISQDTQGFWDLNSPYTNYYDTALNLLAVQETDQAETAKTWLLDEQGNDGCWQSIRDTAFILYAGWPREPSTPISPDTDYCTQSNHYCLIRGECSDAGGEILDNYYCPGVGKICCSKQAIEKTCTEQGGNLCSSGETCTGSVVPSSDSGTCCSGDCQTISITPDCIKQGFSCRPACLSDEKRNYDYDDCTGADICCEKIPPSPSYWWVWLLVILIILIVLAIIFKDKLRLFIFKSRNKFKAGKVSSSPRPPFPPSQPMGMMSRPIFRQPLRRGPISPKPRPSSGLDKEFEDTLKKLREIGK